MVEAAENAVAEVALTAVEKLEVEVVSAARRAVEADLGVVIQVAAAVSAAECLDWIPTETGGLIRRRSIEFLMDLNRLWNHAESGCVRDQLKM